MTSIEKKLKNVYSKNYQSANFPIDAEGRTYHVGTKSGEVSNRIITVGDHYRAFQIAENFDNVKPSDLKITKAGPYKIQKSNLFIYLSKRNFLTITGTYKGVPISVIAICMGMPMMDFFIRETRHVVKGPMAIIRFGSCGSLKDIETGSIAIAKGAFMISRNYDYFKNEKEGSSPYLISDVCKADEQLQKILKKNLEDECRKDKINIVEGLNGSADSFYGSQARTDDDFVDFNSTLLEEIHKKHPECITLEMETFGLFHLSECCKSTYNKKKMIKEKDEPSKKRIKLSDDEVKDNSIKVAATTMIFANRVTNAFLESEKIPVLQARVTKALLNTLVEIDLGKQEDLQPIAGSVWEKMNENLKN